MLLVRFLFGISGPGLTDDAVDQASCTRCTPAEIAAYLEALLGP